jgi:hypothetical protein
MTTTRGLGIITAMALLCGLAAPAAAETPRGTVANRVYKNFGISRSQLRRLGVTTSRSGKYFHRKSFDAATFQKAVGKLKISDGQRDKLLGVARNLVQVGTGSRAHRSQPRAQGQARKATQSNRHQRSHRQQSAKTTTQKQASWTETQLNAYVGKMVNTGQFEQKGAMSAYKALLRGKRPGAVVVAGMMAEHGAKKIEKKLTRLEAEGTKLGAVIEAQQQQHGAKFQAATQKAYDALVKQAQGQGADVSDPQVQQQLEAQAQQQGAIQAFKDTGLSHVAARSMHLQRKQNHQQMNLIDSQLRVIKAQLVQKGLSSAQRGELMGQRAELLEQRGQLAQANTWAKVDAQPLGRYSMKRVNRFLKQAPATQAPATEAQMTAQAPATAAPASPQVGALDLSQYKSSKAMLKAASLALKDYRKSGAVDQLAKAAELSGEVRDRRSMGGRLGILLSNFLPWQTGPRLRRIEDRVRGARLMLDDQKNALLNQSAPTPSSAMDPSQIVENQPYY